MNAIRLSRIAEITGNRCDSIRNDIKITSLCCDSRKAVSDSAFFCIVGAERDGHDYALAAYERGCRVFICERVPRGFPIKGTRLVFCEHGTRKALADVSAEFYGHPEKSMKLIAITGTKGKTTTAHMIYSTLNRYGVRTGYIGTNGIDFENYHFETVNTTPESCDLYEYLSMMLTKKVYTAVIEVSSQALMTGRVRGLVFDICVFTNLFPDHIGGAEHPTFENYKECKKLLFSEHCGRFAVINNDSPEADEFYSMTPKGIMRINYSIHNPSDFKGELISLCRDENGLGTEFLCKTAKESVPVRLNFPGTFSVMNALAAIAVCRIFGLPLKNIAASLSQIVIEGRFETLRLGGVDFVIDYAHNGESLRSALTVLRKYRPEKLICLFGSVGGRTQQRRADMGDVAAKLADFSVITADNPNNERPEDIISEIAAQYKPGQDYVTITDRRDAIRYAVKIAKPGDIVLLAGKGHEKYQLICGKRVPFYEKEIIKESVVLFSQT